MELQLENFSVSIDGADFIFNDLGKDGAFKYFDPERTIPEKYEMMLESLVSVSGLKMKGRDITADEFKVANISLQAMGKILRAFSEGMISGEQEKAEKNDE